MTTPTYDDVAFHLNANGEGVLGTDLFAGEWGINVDAQTLVLEGPSPPMDLKGLFEQTAVQILVRGLKQQADFEVYEKARSVSDFLLALPDSVELNSVCYKGFEESSNIAPLGKDKEERFIYSMNFITYRNR